MAVSGDEIHSLTQEAGQRAVGGWGEEWTEKEGMVGVEMRFRRNKSSSYYHSQTDYNPETCHVAVSVETGTHWRAATLYVAFKATSMEATLEEFCQSNLLTEQHLSHLINVPTSLPSYSG